MLHDDCTPLCQLLQPTEHSHLGRINVLLWKAGEGSNIKVDWGYCALPSSPISPYTSTVVFIWLDTWWSFCMPRKRNIASNSLSLYFSLVRMSFYFLYVFGLYCPFLGTSVNAPHLLSKTWRFISWTKKLSWLSSPLKVPYVWQHLLLASHDLCPAAIWDLISFPQQAAGGSSFLVSWNHCAIYFSHKQGACKCRCLKSR